MLSVTGSIPPASSICIIKEVPERGSPATMIISSFTGMTERGQPAALPPQSHENGLAGAPIADFSQSCPPFFDSLLKACLSVHHLEKILQSSTAVSENARACPWPRRNLPLRSRRRRAISTLLKKKGTFLNNRA